MHKNDKNIINRLDVEFLFSKNVLFKSIYDSYGMPPEWDRASGFETLVKIILEQQVSLSSAKAHFDKLKEVIGGITPKLISEATENELNDGHLSRQKKVYVKALAEAVLSGELDFEMLEELTEPEVREQLTKIKGIGNWTADVYLMMCLKQKDIFPIGDIALRNTLKELTGATSVEEMLAIAEEWRPVRTLATFFLWHHYLTKRGRTLPT